MSPTTTVSDPILAIDTATSTAVVALGARDGSVIVADAWIAGFRHGEELVARIERLLERASVERAEIGAVAVGTGPGAFTGLRVGLATAKGLAHGLGRPIVGVPSSETLLEAARRVGVADPIALLLPAGPNDRVLVTTSADGAVAPARRISGEADIDLGPGATTIAVDLEGRMDAAAVALGARARDGIAGSLVDLSARRLDDGRVDDLAALVPEYVGLPRGVTGGAATRDAGVAISGAAGGIAAGRDSGRD
jgi:tRNA threonylcarbamoyladenosine biosynthesis protein TsaB